MNADSDYQIGKDHTVCEDYALAGIEGGIPHAIVCDGCSASADVDLGARVLALSAKEQMKFGFDVYDYFVLGEQVIKHAAEIYKLFPSLNANALDATLLTTFVEKNNVYAHIYGDGVFFHKSQYSTYAVHVSLESGAPSYLSYILSKSRIKAYEEQFSGNKIISTVFIDNATKGVTVENSTFKPFDCVTLKRPVQPGDIIGVASDGINSFRRANNDPIDWKDLIEEYIGYKNFEGVFAKRRFSAFKRKCVKDGVHHSDDISIASIIV